MLKRCHIDDGNEQYGVSISAKCDIGIGTVKKKLAVLSLDPETKGYVLEFINIRDDVSVVGVDFCKSNNFILLCTENKYLLLVMYSLIAIQSMKEMRKCIMVIFE